VNFRERYARADTGNVQDKCVDCGACVTGCNVTAKSTVDMNYLSVAERQGAEIYVETEVLGVEPAATGFRVHLRDSASGEVSVIVAGRVVLAAGVLGSFKILRKSADDHGLRVSPALGTRFTGNGDILGFGYDSREPAEPSSGPTITTRVMYASDPDITKHFIIEDGGIPQAVTAILRAALPEIEHKRPPSGGGLLPALRDWVRTGADFVGLTGFGALRRSMTYFGMGTEGTTGTLRIEGDAVKVSWPGVANEAFARRIDDRMQGLTFALGASYVKNPDARCFLREKIVTAHPLGGCPMGDDPATAVVDARGAVFGYEGTLFVADGSIIPTALGLNPALTIAALSEYIVENIAAAS
jgi:cholesterol oxidase